MKIALTQSTEPWPSCYFWDYRWFSCNYYNQHLFCKYQKLPHRFQYQQCSIKNIENKGTFCFIYKIEKKT